MSGALRFQTLFGLQCLCWAVFSGIAHTGYALHEVIMGVAALTNVALIAGAMAIWRWLSHVSLQQGAEE